MSAHAIAIRRAVADTRRICPAADVDNIAEYTIREGVALDAVKVLLFGQIMQAATTLPPHAWFRRHPSIGRAPRRPLAHTDTGPRKRAAPSVRTP